jgi:hypothetical protein
MRQMLRLVCACLLLAFATYGDDSNCSATDCQVCDGVSCAGVGCWSGNDYVITCTNAAQCVAQCQLQID